MRVFWIQQVQLVLLTLHITQQVVGRYVAALGFLVICPTMGWAFRVLWDTPTPLPSAPQPTLVGDECGRGVEQNCIAPCISFAAVQPRLTAQPWGHILQIETGGRKGPWVGGARAAPAPGESCPRHLPVHEGQATGATLAHAVVEVRSGHQARAAVDDPQHGPCLRHLGAGTGHLWVSWTPSTPCRSPSAWTE